MNQTLRHSRSNDCARNLVANDTVWTDAELIQQFIASHDDIAFAKLVQRHGPLVMSVCRRLLLDEQEAEDAFQATFLILARKAHTLKKGIALPAWLHTTSRRVALKCRSNRIRRNMTMIEAEPMLLEHLGTLNQISDDHQRTIIDEEIERLPSRLRLPLFLCCIEGLTRAEAAEQLGWSVGSLKGRLERARALLRRRLSLRGVSFSVAIFLLVQAKESIAAIPAPALVAATVQAGTQFIAGKPVLGYVSQNAFQLAQWSINPMLFAISKPAMISLVVTGSLLGVGQIPIQADADETPRRTLRVGQTLNSESTTLVAAFDEEGEEEVVEDFGFEIVVGEFVLNSDEGEEDSAAGGFGSNEEGEEEEEAHGFELAIEESEEFWSELKSREERAQTDAQRQRLLLNLLRETQERAIKKRNEESKTFKPQSDREAALFEMIEDLRRDIESLKAANRVEKEVTLQSWSQSSAGRMFLAHDKNRDGMLSLDEWMALRAKQLEKQRREADRQSFELVDPNTDGNVSVDEYREWFEDVSNSAHARVTIEHSRRNPGSSEQEIPGRETKLRPRK